MTVLAVTLETELSTTSLGETAVSDDHPKFADSHSIIHTLEGIDATWHMCNEPIFDLGLTSSLTLSRWSNALFHDEKHSNRG